MEEQAPTMSGSNFASDAHVFFACLSTELALVFFVLLPLSGRLFGLAVQMWIGDIPISTEVIISIALSLYPLALLFSGQRDMLIRVTVFCIIVLQICIFRLVGQQRKHTPNISSLSVNHYLANYLLPR